MDNIWRPVDPEPRDDIVFLESLPTKNLALEHISEYLPKDMVYLVENMINSTEREDRLMKKIIFWMCCPTAGCVAPWNATLCKRWHESMIWNFLREGLLPTLKFRSRKRILIRARFQATIVPYCEALWRWYYLKTREAKTEFMRSFLRYDPGFGELYSPDRLERSVSANYLFTELHVDLHKAAFVCKKTLNDMDIQLETEMQITLNSVDERLRGASFVPYPEGYILV
jgi:hypothetical protein